LFSLSSSAAVVLPAAISKAEPVAQEREITSVEFLPTEILAKDYMPISDSENIGKYVKDYFSDIPVMTRIAKCESRNRQVNKSGGVIRGEKNTYDVGVMQINELYHAETAKKMGINLYSLDGNVRYARYLYEKQGTKPWMSSAPCWAKLTESQIAALN
jgi:hypothetical protein